MVRWIVEPRSGDREFVNRFRLIVAPFGARFLGWLTQGSQSLALGLTLTAATQLVGGSRLVSSSYDSIGTTVPMSQVCESRFNGFHSERVHITSLKRGPNETLKLNRRRLVS